MSIKSIIGKFLTSACYIGLLLMFSYTSFFYEVVVNSHIELLDMFNKVQGTWSGFIVNIGLLLMLLIDYSYNKCYVPRWSLVISILAFGILALVYFFAGHAEIATKYNQPFNWPWLGVLLYAFFTIYLVMVKWLSLPYDGENKTIMETYSN